MHETPTVETPHVTDLMREPSAFAKGEVTRWSNRLRPEAMGLATDQVRLLPFCGKADSDREEMLVRKMDSCRRFVPTKVKDAERSPLCFLFHRPPGLS
jgi:hypothetical protein